MEKKKKLQLRKETIATLDDKSQFGIFGGNEDQDADATTNTKITCGQPDCINGSDHVCNYTKPAGTCNNTTTVETKKLCL